MTKVTIFACALALLALTHAAIITVCYEVGIPIAAPPLVITAINFE